MISSTALLLLVALSGCSPITVSGGGNTTDTTPASDCPATDDTGTPTDCDVDGDGHEAASCGGDDCNDNDAAINPDMPDETCDGVDNDCDGVDEYKDTNTDTGTVPPPDAGDTSACGGVDNDGDHYMDVDGEGNVVDCNDNDATVHPNADEVCDGVDQDCDGFIDNDAIDATTWYADADSDGYGDASTATDACAAPSGYVADGTDCDDTAADVNPGATDDTCDGRDDNCDGTIDESATSGSTWYLDADSDGYGDASTATDACAAPSGYVADGTDCDDTSAAVNPGEEEIPYDGLDNNCGGDGDEVDIDCDGVDYTIDCDDTDPTVDVATTWYADADSDGYGDASTATDACAAPSGYVADGTDCDDAHPTIHPGATEYCDGIDSNCNGTVNDGDAGGSTWYLDADSDGYGNATVTTEACAAPSGYVADGTDCDDNDNDAWAWTELLTNGNFNTAETIEMYPKLGEDWGVDGSHASTSYVAQKFDGTDGYLEVAGDSSTAWGGFQITQVVDPDDFGLVDGSLVRFFFVVVSTTDYEDAFQVIQSLSYGSVLAGGVYTYTVVDGVSESSGSDIYLDSDGEGIRYSIHVSALPEGETMYLDDASFEACLGG
jgi:hypothetical protein